MMYQKHWKVFLRHSILGLKHRAADSPALWYSLRIILIKTASETHSACLNSGSVFSLLSLHAFFAPIITEVSCFYVPLKVSVTFSGSVSISTRTMLPSPNRTFISVGRLFELSKSPARQGGKSKSYRIS